MGRRRTIQEGSPSQPKQRPHFFKIIVKASLQSGELMIPIQFTRDYLKKIADVAVLKVPNGKNWQVQVKKVDGSIKLQNGWRGFLEYYSISVGDFLVFRYDGNSTFSVLMFDQSAFEMEYPSDTDEDLQKSELHTECLIPVKKEPEEDDCVEPICASPPFQPLPPSTEEALDKAQEVRITKRRPGRKKSAKKQRRSCKHQEVIEIPLENPNLETSVAMYIDNVQHGNSDVDNSPTLVPSPSSGDVKPLALATREVESNYLGQEGKCKESSASNSTSAPEPREHLDPSPIKHEENVRMLSSHGYKKFKATRKRLVTNQQRQKAICTAQMFKTENPSVMIIMKPSYVYKGMVLNFPKKFAREYLDLGVHNVKLSTSDGRTWMVRCSQNDRKAMITGGWPKFVRDNKLEEGDCCVFEVSQAKGMEFIISIFRVVEEAESVY